jgi:hypothetical protein
MRETGERRTNLQGRDTLDIKLASRIWHPLRTAASNKQENSYFVAKDLRLRMFESMLDRGCERRMKPNENSNDAFERSRVSSSHNVSETFVAMIRNIR